MPDVRDFTKLPGYLPQDVADAMSQGAFNYGRDYGGGGGGGGGRDALANALMAQQGMSGGVGQPFEPNGPLPLPTPTMDPRSMPQRPVSVPPDDAFLAGGRGMPQLPSWFQGGRGAFNRAMRNFNVGGQFLPSDFGDSSGGGGSFGDIGGGGIGSSGPPSGSPTGSSPTGGPPTGGPPGTDPDAPTANTGPTAASSVVGPDFEGQYSAVAGGFAGPGSYGGAVGQSSLPSSTSSIPAGVVGGTQIGNVGNLTPGQLMEALGSMNQAQNPDLQGGAFSTAGMSIADLADAWGVSIDSAQALADAGFADLGGFGDSGGVGDGPGSGDDPGGGGDPGDDF